MKSSEFFNRITTALAGLVSLRTAISFSIESYDKSIKLNEALMGHIQDSE